MVTCLLCRGMSGYNYYNKLVDFSNLKNMTFIFKIILYLCKCKIKSQKHLYSLWYCCLEDIMDVILNR